MKFELRMRIMEMLVTGPVSVYNNNIIFTMETRESIAICPQEVNEAHEYTRFRYLVGTLFS